MTFLNIQSFKCNLVNSHKKGMWAFLVKVFIFLLDQRRLVLKYSVVFKGYINVKRPNGEHVLYENYVKYSKQ